MPTTDVLGPAAAEAAVVVVVDVRAGVSTGAGVEGVAGVAGTDPALEASGVWAPNPKPPAEAAVGVLAPSPPDDAPPSKLKPPGAGAASGVVLSVAGAGADVPPKLKPPAAGAGAAVPVAGAGLTAAPPKLNPPVWWWAVVLHSIPTLRQKHFQSQSSLLQKAQQQLWAPSVHLLFLLGMRSLLRPMEPISCHLQLHHYDIGENLAAQNHWDAHDIFGMFPTRKR